MRGKVAIIILDDVFFIYVTRLNFLTQLLINYIVSVGNRNETKEKYI